MSLPLAIGPSVYWYVTRGSGVVALILLTFALVLGVADVRRFSTPRWPRFVIDSLHRSVSLLAVVFLGVHILTTVLDSFTSISLVDAIVPFGSSYRPFWLGLGAVAFDLLIALVITSLLRRRLGYRVWRFTHWFAYACWPVAIAHGLGTGSDLKFTWLLAINGACAAAVLGAILVRVLPGVGGASEAGLPRLLRGIGADEPLDLEQHEAIHGVLPLRRRRRGQQIDEELLGRIERSGLRGHGGAAFPTAVKLRATIAAKGRPIVIVNACEGEPASLKDKLLLERLPHLVLDGGLLAAAAVGADELIVCVSEAATEAQRGIARALAERQAASRRLGTLSVVTVPDRYISGQESALVNHINGKPALPGFTPPMVFERGVRRRPTLVNNAETLAHLALIARHGSDWFRELGTPAQPGSTLVSLSGAVLYPDVYEIEHGASLGELVGAAGGTVGSVRAVLVGGYSGAWVGAGELSSLRLENEQLAAHGAMLGAGVIALLGEDCCGVAETARIARWFAQQGAGQCGPCVHGLRSIATEMQAIANGTAPADALQRIAGWTALTMRRGACGHPDGAVRLISSALEVFAEELADHARRGPCSACRGGSQAGFPLPPPRSLPRPRALATV
jgi:NADH:ubiquinone oxidoreductase subunit F (NADH-binding)/DMSO/TMAO reductase YedYZ heme-binding membrane subunit